MLGNVNNLGHSASRLRGHASLRKFAHSRKRNNASGFTLLEMMIVISIIIILMAVAIPNYNRTVIQSRESVLRSNLSTLRSVISQYTLDKQKAPQSLDDLVQAGYLRQIPVDPMTKETNWEVVQEDVMMAVDQSSRVAQLCFSRKTLSNGNTYSRYA